MPTVTSFGATAAHALLFCTILIIYVNTVGSVEDLRQDYLDNDRARSAFARSGPCGTIEDRLHCIAHTHPVFHNDNCERWDCDPLLSSGLPFFCCMGETTRSEVLEVLNGSVIVWIGDSTARRTNRQLYHWMEGTKFEDYPAHDEVRYNISSISSVSLWVPMFKSAIYNILGLDPETFKLPARLRRALHLQARNESRILLPSPPPLYPSEFQGKRKVFVICISTHSLLWFWNTATEDKLITGLGPDMHYVSLLAVEIVRGLKRYAGVDPGRDIILLRLPIAQACKAYSGRGKRYYPNVCNIMGPGIDPVNIFLERLQRVLVLMMREAHPDVGFLDLLSWTWSEDRVDRAQCTPADVAGTHFGTDTSRLAFVQQVLHAVRLLSVDRLGWETSSASVARSLCPGPSITSQ